MSYRRWVGALLGLLLGVAAGREGRAQKVAPQPLPVGDASAGAGAFASPTACAALLARGARLQRPVGAARFVSWNLRWFPDGEPGVRGSGADISWLACTMAWLDADVIAVQEVKQTPRAQVALHELLRELGRLSGGRFVGRLDDCGRRVPQHVGLLWNELRVKAEDVSTVAALNPSGEACGRQLRPGLAARLSFTGGLDLTVISAHFKSKADERALDLRESSFAALPGVLQEVERRTGDPDLLLLGDLNTMGCDDCLPPVSAREELLAADQGLRAGGLRIVEADAAGSHFHRGKPSLLDHAVVSRRMRELGTAAKTHVSGACAAAAQLAPTGRAAKKARRQLSDHCPIVLDLSDRDLD